MKCMLTRWRISTALDEGQTLSARGTRHLAACPACSRYVAQARLLETALGEGRRDAEPVPVYLHTRIMASLREAAAEAAPARVAWWPHPRLAGMTAATLLVVALGSVVLTNRTENPQSDAGALSPALPAVSVDAYRRMAAGAIHEASTSVTLTMTTEMENLRLDAASAGLHLQACLERGLL
jgi:hypothetical protein